ncbi:MAG: DUF134 domain-containing protein [Clostridiales bacterium]|nr:DUF134 domain-containing protein [Clostridiales bacterium]
MSRPVKMRKVGFVPEIQYFSPSSNDQLAVLQAMSGFNELQENILHIEEVEAIRLKDLEGLEQDLCAERMEVSRQTFQRILNKAREKVADSLINGKAIKIAGGNYSRNTCPVKCLGCGNEWSEDYEAFEKVIKGEYVCPSCSSKEIICAIQDKMKSCTKACWRFARDTD